MKHNPYWKLAALALLLCASDTRNSAPAPAKVTVSSTYKAQQTDAVREALLRAVLPAPSELAYVSFAQQDPSDAFIQRMRRFNVRIQKMSLSPQPFRRGVRRRVSGDIRNPMIWVRPMAWLSRSRVQVQVDWGSGGMHYTLARKNGKWAVVERKMAWIS